MASAEPTRIERRCGHRFSQYQIAVLLKTSGGDQGAGFMPDEITLAGNMSVCCKARVLRRIADKDSGKPAIAVRIEHFEYLPREISVLRHDLTVPHAARPS